MVPPLPLVSMSMSERSWRAKARKATGLSRKDFMRWARERYAYAMARDAYALEPDDEIEARLVRAGLSIEALAEMSDVYDLNQFFDVQDEY